MNKLLPYVKIGFGLLAISALITEIVVLVSRNSFDVINFFSYFTVESNLFAAIILLVGGYYAFKKQTPSSRFDWLRGAATLYMVITGIIFSLLLAGLENVQLTAVPWDNTVLHYIMPVAVITLWLIDPPKQSFSYAKSLLWILFPLGYGAYTWIRGAIVGWYPYPFMNPEVSGIEGLVTVSIGIAVGASVIASGLVLYANWRNNRARATTSV